MSRPSGYSGVCIVQRHAIMPTSFEPGSRLTSSSWPSSLRTSSTALKASAGARTFPAAAVYASHFWMMPTFSIPRNSGAYVEPARRAMERLFCMAALGTAEMARSAFESTSNQATGLPVTGSATSSRLTVFRYSPDMDEAVKRSVSLRLSDAVPTPTLTTISSTRARWRRAPYLDTNLFINCSKRLTSWGTGMSTGDIRCR
mmetsp:Transcript_47203/g.135127  ORF Transcript_47203/g.135127 Transcript_47203/m.135127 type:complete len:201 (+) Transcript_47203:1106-1708(+)